MCGTAEEEFIKKVIYLIIFYRSCGARIVNIFFSRESLSGRVYCSPKNICALHTEFFQRCFLSSIFFKISLLLIFFISLKNSERKYARCQPSEQLAPSTVNKVRAGRVSLFNKNKNKKHFEKTC